MLFFQCRQFPPLSACFRLHGINIDSGKATTITELYDVGDFFPSFYDELSFCYYYYCSSVPRVGGIINRYCHIGVVSVASINVFHGEKWIDRLCPNRRGRGNKFFINARKHNLHTYIRTYSQSAQTLNNTHSFTHFQL